MFPYVPFGQSSHVSAEIAPGAEEYLPVSQSPLQTGCASAPSYLPAAQLSHAVLTPDALYLPAAQLSHAVLTPDVALYLPVSQLSHAALTPDDALYLPAPHT